MRRFKKLTSVILVTAMALSLVACGSKGDSTEATTEEVTEATEATETTEAAEEVVDDGNLLSNGEYSLYTNTGAATMKVKGPQSLQIDIGKIGMVEHGVQVYHDGFGLSKNAEYVLSFDVSSTVERDFDARIQVNGGDYHAYCMTVVHATPEMQHVEYPFVMDGESDPAPRFCFNMGYTASMKDAGVDKDAVEAHTILVENIRLECVDATNAEAATIDVVAPKIKINQVGYKPDELKTVLFSDLDADSFQVVNVDNDEVAFEGEIGKAKHNEGADEDVSTADFSDLTKEGTYKIVAGDEESYEFVISKDPFSDSFNSLMNMFYLQRCGMELTEEYAGTFNHPACHTGDGKLYGSSTMVEVTGGWHDAGDYGRYTVAGAKAVADLLLAYEANPDAFSDSMNIPESGNGVSDVLDEAKYELDWMLKMQKEETGGVRHKVTCEVFPETVMPEEETDQLVVCSVSPAATGDFAAVMAMASRIYGASNKAEYKEFADTCLEASKKAYDYLADNLNKDGFKNPTGVVTGEYPDGVCIDEFFWAAAELFKTTGDKKYVKAIKEKTDDLTDYAGLGWANVGGFGSYALLTAEGAEEADKDVYKKVYDAFIAAADTALENSKNNEYMVNRNTEFEWGSNMGIANDGILFVFANEVSENKEYIEYAKHHLDYLFGVNATGYCFITGVGTLYPESPHHRPSQATGICVPGMLVGGPNSALEDPYAEAVCKDMPAAKCYVDNEQSYSMNEITIYWNSPLVYLMAATEE